MTETSPWDAKVEQLLDELEISSPDGRHSLKEAFESVRDLEAQQVTPILRRTIHRIFERSMGEFFSDETATSMQLPANLARFTLPDPDGITLPHADDLPSLSFAEVLESRRSRRDYQNRPLKLEELSKVLQMAFLSNTMEDGYGIRNIPQLPYPNIGGLDPVEIVVIVNGVVDLDRGHYRYDKVGHALVPVASGDYRQPLLNATFENDWLFYAPAIIILSNDQRKVAWKYKTRGYRIAFMDLGAAMQNLYLACTATQLSCCAVAGYQDDKIYSPGGDRSVGCVMPIGPCSQGGPSSSHKRDEM